MYDELQRCRLEQAEAASAAEGFQTEATNARQQLADLHAELQRLHERARRHQDLALEVTETKEACVADLSLVDLLCCLNRLDDAKEALIAQAAEAKRAAAEWEAERQHLERNAELHRRLLAARNDGADSGPLSDRNAELEDLLAGHKEESAAKLHAAEITIQELRSQLRSVTSKLGKILHKSLISA